MNTKILMFFSMFFFTTANCSANSCYELLSNLNVNLEGKSFSEVRVRNPSPKDLGSEVWDNSGFSLLEHTEVPSDAVSSFFKKVTSNGSVIESGAHILKRQKDGRWNIRPFHGMDSYKALTLPTAFIKTIEHYYQQVISMMNELNMSLVGEPVADDMKFFIYRGGSSVFSDGKFQRKYDDESTRVRPQGYVVQETMGGASITLGSETKEEMAAAKAAHQEQLRKMIDDANPEHLQRFRFNITGILSPDPSGEPLMAFEGVEGNAVELNGSSALFNLSAPRGTLQANNPNFREGVFFKFRFFVERDLNKIEGGIFELNRDGVEVDVDSLFNDGVEVTETPSDVVDNIGVEELFQ